MAERGNSGRSLPPPPGQGQGQSRHPLPPTSPDRDQRESHPRSPPRGDSASYPYPPQSGPWEDRRPPPPTFQLPPMAQPNVTLPSIHGIYQQSYGPSAGPSNPPPVDPRLAPSNYAQSPTAANGHGPPPPGPPPQGAPYPPQYHGPPPPGPHGAPPPGPYADYYALQHRQPPSYPAPPQNGYGPYPGYPGGSPYGEYVQGGHPQQQQIAPRQRTSIACRYCRKRKIRCSGYQNTTNGKCTNCDKLKIDCIFQPVSSGVSQAFIPVSAIPGGVPPGTQLFGAYGQPLPPSGPGQSQNGYPPPPPGYQQHPQHQQPALASPTSQHAPQADGAQHGRRRPRESDEEDRNARLPPPPPPDAYYHNYDSRRRSPVSADSSTPPMYHYQHSTRSFEADRTPTPRRNSPGQSPTTSTMSTGIHSPTSASFPPPPSNSHSLAPPHSGGQMASSSSRSPGSHAPNGARSPTENGRPALGAKSPTAGAEGASSSSIMSLGNLVQGPPPSMPFRGSEIDDSMLGKLNRRS
ncbi:hypothetical protein CONLIGDRAFT_285893 [Coniochaeta ligniaria NRRL 30616]|uniref:Zn(2)-C6 fungal-type domain-containing protein n=1 Tax=Coniochaeta ligniaria NRRL 30616 TaxID=1408157 RepID=A0A1J7ITY1_9PEZI|nr:hypothetical protein CONLIGDRAFT_285893 [Coniochaeta ligniaria NRRL 30616]